MKAAPSEAAAPGPGIGASHWRTPDGGGPWQAASGVAIAKAPPPTPPSSSTSSASAGGPHSVFPDAEFQLGPAAARGPEDEGDITGALAALAAKGLHGVPVAQRVGDKAFDYYDHHGNRLSKEQALALCGGVAYYVEVENPSGGRLRRRGAFVSESDARAILSGSSGGIRGAPKAQGEAKGSQRGGGHAARAQGDGTAGPPGGGRP